MPKAVSFAAILDPALLVKGDRAGDEGVRNSIRDTTGRKKGLSGRKVEEKTSLSHNSSDRQSGHISTNDSTTEELIKSTHSRKGKAKAKDDEQPDLLLDPINRRRSSAKLRLALTGESPIVQRLVTASPSFRDADPGADSTESIEEFSTTMERSRPFVRTISAPPAIHVPSSSLTKNANILAQCLASEEVKKRKHAEEHSKKQRDEVKRRMMYGSERRKLERQSRRLARNPKGKMIKRQGGLIIDDPSELRKNPLTVPVLSQNDTELFKEDTEPPIFSQQSNFSVESDDGVYQTQFSFFHFESEQIEDGAKDSAQNDMQALLKDVTENQEESQSLQSLTQTQAAYEADRSASWSLSDPQSSTAVIERETGSSNASQRISDGVDSSSQKMAELESISNDNAIANEFEFIRTSSHALVEPVSIPAGINEADQKRLRALCLDDGGLKNNNNARRVQPTIWQGHPTVKGKF